VFRPDAVTIEVLLDGPGRQPVPMKEIHAEGIFEAIVLGVGLPLSYFIDVHYETDRFKLRDPYAFPPAIGELDVHLVHEGTHEEAWKRLGAHVHQMGGVMGTAFAVWAPEARRVSVVGDFNHWDGRLHAMRRMGGGIWEIFLPDVGEGALYKFEILTPDGARILKSDPYGMAMELRPQTASKVVVRRYAFTDEAWLQARSARDPKQAPLSIYEVHLGSWRRAHRAAPEPRPQATGWLTYRELAEELVDYVADLGFTHIELLPITEHPYDGSWGYQVSGYFAPTSRHGTPDDFRYFIDRCHARGIGVLLDWAPAHFPKDAAALGRFDGTAVYEHLDPRQGEHKHWGTYVFNYARGEVRNFLISSALYWLEEFHIDGLRVDAVASMLYLDYSAESPGDWVANEYGGRENLAAVAFLRNLADRVHARCPGAMLLAEESTTWPGVTRPTYVGGLGFDFKWNMGWMHDTLDYFALDPIHRAFHHGKLTFGLMYAFSEQFLLPLSHDEVVHLKRSLLSKMPGDRWQKLANLRALYGYMWAHPGKKLLFMGGEIGQWEEWNFESELDWALLHDHDHRGLQSMVRDLNQAYLRYPALYERCYDWRGFQWVDANDASQSVLSFIRYPGDPPTSTVASPRPNGQVEERGQGEHLLFVGNFTPVVRWGYRVGVPRPGTYLEVINSDAKVYGGSGLGNFGRVETEEVPSHGFPQSIALTLPPLAVLWLVPELAASEG
jgi:1,4-alpha-glucan branching enzyme